MKLRRAFLAFVVLAGFLVLILGVTGVLSPKKQEPVVSKAASQGPATIEDFKIESDTWRLHADQARPRLELEMTVDMAKALAKKDFTQAGESLKKLADAAAKGELSNEQKEKLENELKEIATSLGDYKQFSEALNSLSKTISDAQMANLQKALGEAMVAIDKLAETNGDFKMLEGGGYELINPSLEVKQAGASGEERLTVQARKGVETEKPDKRVHMSGGVRIEFTGAEKIVLTTPSVEVAPDQATGRTADEVEMVVDTKEGRQHIWGKGAEFDSKQRLIVVSENIRMELTGGGSDIFPPAAGKPAAAPALRSSAATAGEEEPVTKIECRGPATADGFKRTVELKGDVRVQQGEDWLRAGRLEVQFAENSRAPERFAADGAVTFKASGAEGDCDHLERSAVEDTLRLEGNPARVRRGANEIEAERIELSGQNLIVVQAPGRLKLAGEDAARPAETITVNWSRMLRFDLNEHKSLFLGDVRFARGDQTIECQTLSVKLDSENRRILECKADTDVRLAARMQGGAGPESVTAQARDLVYDPQKDLVVLSGGAEMQQGQRTIRGERIEIHPDAAEIAVPGAGSLEGQAEKDSEGFSVTWEREMRFSRATQSALFQGGVGLKYGGDTLRAESVTARLSENALKGFVATGGVDLVQTGGAEQSGRTLKADSLSAEIGADRKLQGLDASGRVAIREEVEAEHLTRTLTADRVLSEPDEKTKLQGYEATGHVTLREDAPAGVTTIRAARMKAKLDVENQLETFEAVGRPVIVEQEGRIAYGDRLTWDAQRDSGALFGSPAELRLGQSRVFGERLEFAPKRGAITVISNRRVEATVVGGAPGTAILLP
jgi:lipopolysaccharide transport protein LptA